jgi:tetratricopeptide (TPR) repeat protein
MSYHMAEPLIRICTRPLEPEWIERLSDPLKVQVLAPLLADAALRLDEQDAAYRLMEQYFPPLAAKHPEVAYALAEQRLLRGRLEGIEALLAKDDSARALALLGWLRFLQGAGDSALACFEAALKTIRRKTRKRIVYVKGMAGLFYLLALLESGGPDHLKTLQQQVLMCAKTPEEEVFEDVIRLLGDTAAVLLGELRPEQSLWLQRDSLTLDPYLELFRCLALHWLGEKPSARQTADLPRYFQSARVAGLHWYVRESALLLVTLGKRPDGEQPPPAADAPPAFRTLTDLIRPRAPWELALDALKQLSAPSAGGEIENSAGANLRMAWRLSCYGQSCTLEPREQKRAKRGGWTRGRPVSLEKLSQMPGDYDYLTPQDRRICSCIVTETEYAYFNRYPTTVYQLDQERALLQAIGHPLVFRAEAPDASVELVRGEPVLEVLRERGRLRLRLDPGADGEAGVVTREESGGRIRLIQLDETHKRIAGILGSKGLTVPLAAKDRVLESINAIAPLLTVHSAIGGGSAAAAVAADSRPHLHLQPAGAGLRLELYIQPFAEGGPLFRPGQGGSTVFAEVAGKPLQTERDAPVERRGADVVLEQCPALDREADWSWSLEHPEEALDTLERLQGLGEAVVLEWPQGRKIRLAAEAGPGQMQVSVRKQRDWLALDGGLLLEDGRVLAMAQLLELIRQSPGRFLQLAEGEFLSLTGELRRRLDAIRAFSDAGRFHPLAAVAIAEATEGMQLKAGKPWRELLARFDEAQGLEPGIPTTLQAQLRDDQAEGFRWLARLAHWGAGACLADDMGLGKTVQALALILTRAHAGPTLVLAPTSVCMNWLEEAQRFAPTLRPAAFGPGDLARMLEQAGPYDLIVCSYGLLQSESERLAAVDWHTIAADEAQAIKNPLTKRSKAAMALSGAFRMITTGTPIENHLGELWNLFRFINPGLLGPLERFNRRFAVPIEQERDHDARQRLKQLIRPFILRRLKSDVLAELPPRTEITLQVELSAEETALYEALRRQAQERMAAPEEHPGQHRIRLLAEIMRLRRACCHPELVLPGSGIGSAKLSAFTEILEELRENRHKALVFSQFVGHLALIRAYLDEHGIRYQYLDGSTPVKRRKSAVDAFQAGDGELFLISLKAGGSGLNLTAADYVIHMDPWWNPAVEDQASDRAHRIGQQRPVTVYRLVAKGTIEEKIVEMHRHKRDLADSLLEGTDAGGRMSVEEMMALLGEEEE